MTGERETLWETFNKKPATYLLSGLAMAAVSVATRGMSTGVVLRAAGSAVLSQGANLLMDNRNQDGPRAGAATWAGVSLLGNFAMNLTRPADAVVGRVLPALADAQIATATGLAVKAVNAGTESLAPKLGFGALAGAIAGASTVGPQPNAESAAQAMGYAGLRKAGERVGATGFAELTKRVQDLNRAQPAEQASRPLPIPPQKESGPAMR